MQLWLEYLNEFEVGVCRRWSRSTGQRQWIRQGFALISRLGDGVFWYVLIGVLASTQGALGAQAALHMLLTGGAALALYKALKRFTRRERPCHHATDIIALVAPLDRYSFPSGHTLHAVSFSLVAVHYFPDLVWILAPFTLLVASSRVVLGLHYPSDVLMATAIGVALAQTSLSLL